MHVSTHGQPMSSSRVQPVRWSRYWFTWVIIPDGSATTKTEEDGVQHALSEFPLAVALLGQLRIGDGHGAFFRQRLQQVHVFACVGRLGMFSDRNEHTDGFIHPSYRDNCRSGAIGRIHQRLFARLPR